MNKKFYIVASIILSLFLTFVIYIYLNTSNNIHRAKEALIENANTHFSNIKNARTWNAKYGHIYSDNSDLTPNSYLMNNTLEIEDGRKLVKINPAWMTRQLSQLLQSDTMNFSIISNKPINPNNQAVGFFQEGLYALEKESKVNFKYKIFEEQKEFKFIGALRVKFDCLKCHGMQGYQVGDLRGGIAITLDASHYLADVAAISGSFSTTITIATLFLLLFLYTLYRWMNKHDEIERINSSLDKKVKQQVKKLDTLNQELKRYNSKLNNVIHGSNLGYWDWELENDKYYVNDRWLEILGLSRADVSNTQKDFMLRLHPIDKSHIMPKIYDAMDKDKNFNVEFRMLNKIGDYIWIEASGAVVERNKDGEVLRVSGTHQDISKRKGLESIRNKNREYLNILFDNNPNIVVVTNAHEILSTNNQFFKYFPEFSSIKEFKQEYSCICDLFEYVKESNFLHPTKNENWVQDALDNPNSKALIKYKDQYYYFKVIASLVKFDGEPLYITTFTDITQQQLLQKKLEEISIIDELTGLYNRRHFNKVMKEEFKRAKELETTLAFVMIDIDNFKMYNDNYGHDKGDEILESVAKEFKASLKRSSDNVFRLGGEEFGLLFNNLDYSYSVEYANSIRKNIAQLKIPHSYNDEYGIITISIGVCFVDFSSDSIGINDIYHYADQALYESKMNGRNVVSSWRLH
ncbi:MAG: diguanylate cyclase [Campylobacterota bacterium]|nr:diguanylate cyclase [Campylobacterota bacterium]